MGQFVQPRLSRSNNGHAQQEGTNLGVFVPEKLVLPRYEATNLGVFDLCVISLCSNGAVQIRLWVWSSLIALYDAMQSAAAMDYFAIPPTAYIQRRRNDDKNNFERSSQKGERQGVRKEGQQGTNPEN